MPAIIEQANNIIVNGSHFIKHDYYFHRIPQLVESLYRIGVSGKTIKITFPDGEPIRYTGLEHVLAIISSEFSLIPGNLIVRTTDMDFKSNFATVEYFLSPFFRDCKKVLSTWQDQSLDNAVLFGATFGRYTLERFLLASFLGTNYPNSFLIFQPPADVIEFEFDGLEGLYTQELEWYKNYKHSEISLPSEHNGLVNWAVGCDDYKNIWSKYLIEIVVETDCHCRTWITEKTLRCLITGKPFISMTGAGFLSWLRDLGFKTYSDLIDESYDQETKSTIRLDMIKTELDKIARFTPAQLEQLNDIALYNKQEFSKIFNNYDKSQIQLRTPEQRNN